MLVIINNKKWNRCFTLFSAARYQSPFWSQIILLIFTQNISLMLIFPSFFLLCPHPRGLFVSSTSINNFHADLISPTYIIAAAAIRFFAIISITLALYPSSLQIYLWQLISQIPKLTYSDWVKDKVACSFYEREDKIRIGRSKSSEMWRFNLGYVVSEISKCREDVNFRKNQSKNNGDKDSRYRKRKPYTSGEMN